MAIEIEDPYCGTTTGYKHHLKRGEDACRPCKDANVKAAQRFRINSPEKAKAINLRTTAKALLADPNVIQRRNLKNMYGITLEEYNTMYSRQDGLCALCGKPESTVWRGKQIRLAVDHCHNSGKVRSLLCKNCNTGLGAFNDDEGTLLAAIEYVRMHR